MYEPFKKCKRHGVQSSVMNWGQTINKSMPNSQLEASNQISLCDFWLLQKVLCIVQENTLWMVMDEIWLGLYATKQTCRPSAFIANDHAALNWWGKGDTFFYGFRGYP